MINVRLILQKTVILTTCSVLLATVFLVVIFFIQALGTGLEKQFQRLTLEKIINAYLMTSYGFLPSFVGIAFAEFQKRTKIRDYIISATLCVLIMLITLFTWVETIHPYLEAAKPVASNNFSNITAHPASPPIPTWKTLLSIGFYASFISIANTSLYWFCAVRKKKNS
jgi:type III secretory pathway component EscS